MASALEEALIIDYVVHALFIPLGYAILRLSGTGGPTLRLLPTIRSLKGFALLTVLFATIEIVVNSLGDTSGSSAASYPAWFIIGSLAFEGVFVGWTEEYLFRGSIQRALNSGLHSGTQRWSLRRGTLIAAILFAVFHFTNLALGASLQQVLPQATFALFFGLIVGIYYDRADDLAAIAWIHNITDLLGTFF